MDVDTEIIEVCKVSDVEEKIGIKDWQEKLRIKIMILVIFLENY